MESKWSRLTLKGVIFAEVVAARDNGVVYKFVQLGGLLYDALKKQDEEFKDLRERFGIKVLNRSGFLPDNLIRFVSEETDKIITYFNPEAMLILLKKIQNGVPVPYDTLTSIAVELGLIEDTNMKEVEEGAKNIVSTSK